MTTTDYIQFPEFGDYEIYLIITDDDIAVHVHSLAKKYGILSDIQDGQAGAATISAADGRCFVVLPSDPNVAFIAHECAHAVDRLFEYMGAEHEKEIYAYILGYLVKETTDLYTFHVEKKKKKQAKLDKSAEI